MSSSGRDLEASRAADEYELILVGIASKPAVAKARRLGKVAVPAPKNLDLTAFRQQAAHLLDLFMAADSLPTGGPHLPGDVGGRAGGKAGDTRHQGPTLHPW